MAEDGNLTRWVVGIVASGLVGLLVFFARWVFGGVFKRLDDMLGEVRVIGSRVSEHATQLAVLNQQLGQLQNQLGKTQQENADLRTRQDKLAEHWQERFEELQKEFIRLANRGAS